MRPLLLISLWLVLANPAGAQTKKIDSLRAVLANHPQADTFRVNRLVDLARTYLDNGPLWSLNHSADSLAQLALQTARQIHSPYAQAEVFNLQAILALNTMQNELGRQLSHQALLMARRSGDQRQIQRMLSSLGLTYYTTAQSQQRAAYKQQDAARGIDYLEQALALARRLNDKERIIEGVTFLAYYSQGQQQQHYIKQMLAAVQQLKNNGRLLDALMMAAQISQGQQRERYYQQALVSARTTKDNEKIFDTYLNIAAYYSTSDYPRALQWGYALLGWIKKDTNSIHQYKAVSRVAEIYTGLKDYDQALLFLKRSQPIAQKRGDRPQQGASLVRMAEIYQKKKQPDQAISLLRQALPLLGNRRPDWVARINAQLGECSILKNAYQSALAYARQALRVMQSSEDQYGYYTQYRDRSWLVLSQAHLGLGGLDSALYYGKKCLLSANVYKETGSLDFARDVSGVFAQIYAQTGDYRQAYRYQSQYMAYKDSLNNEEVARKATALRFTQQMNRQQGQISLLQKDKQLQVEESRRQGQLLYTSLIVLLLIVGLLVVVYRNNRQKQKSNALLQNQRDQTQQALMELKATQAQLIQKEKLASLGELTAGIAHEIQNPLNFVNNFSEVSAELVSELEEEQQKPTRDTDLEVELLGDLKQNLHKIHQHGQRASGIVKGMLEHSRSSSGEVQPTDLNALADEYLRLAYHGQRAKDKDFTCELVTQFDPAISQVNLMAQEMGRVLLNLFTNAFYAVRTRQQQAEADYQPTVTVSTQKTKAGIEVRVADNGTGIPDSVQQKIFQPFFTTKPTGEGTGLGLSLAYDIVTKGHGGSLLVQSRQGQGTEFIVKLST